MFQNHVVYRYEGVGPTSMLGRAESGCVDPPVDGDRHGRIRRFHSLVLEPGRARPGPADPLWASADALVAEPVESRPGPEFQRDRDRIIHTTAFRRAQPHDPGVRRPMRAITNRTRLTHTIEVAQIRPGAGARAQA